jgi:hypothetical protein
MLDLPEDNGRIKRVKNIEELRKAIEDAKEKWKDKGGHIIFENDTFKGDGKPFNELKFDMPLVIRADTIGGCTIEGEGQFAFNNSKNVWLYGINFKQHTSEEQTVVFSDCKNCVVAGCDFQTTSSNKRKDDDGEMYPWYSYLAIGGGDCNYVAYNSFHDKANSRGHFLWVSGEAKRTVIEYNHFENLPGIGKKTDDGFTGSRDKGEAIKMGDSDFGNKAFASIVRYNLFEHCQGDTECVTNKSCCNVYHHNTFRNNHGSLCFRHGSFNIARNNTFIGEDNGIRLYGTQLIKGNYWKSSKRLDHALGCPLVIGGGDTDELKSGNLHFQVRDSRFENNYIISESPDNEENDRIVIWGYGGEDKFRPKNNYFQDNTIIAQSGTMLMYDNADKLEQEDLDKYFTDNILYNQGSAKYGDIITKDNGTGQCQPPPDKAPGEPMDIKILESKDVGPNSGRVDQPHFSREELQEIVEEFREVQEFKDKLREQLKSIIGKPC